MKGFSATELLIAIVLTLLAAGGISMLWRDAHDVFRAQPEASDLLQRTRSGLDWLYADLVMAGAGGFDRAGPLARWIPAIFPQRRSRVRPDADDSAFTDRMTVLAIPPGAPQANLSGSALSGSAFSGSAAAGGELLLASSPTCPRSDPACGFRARRHGIVFDGTGAFDLVAIDDVGPGWLLVNPSRLSKLYSAAERAQVAEVRATTYYFDASRRQLRRSEGSSIDMPLLDDVLSLQVRYFGDPFPPTRPGGAGVPSCVADASGTPLLPTLGANHGTLVELTSELLSDGPWCGVAPHRFDADLYRVRQVRVGLRLQASAGAARGMDRARFQVPGIARFPGAQVPDVAVHIEVAPRNLGLGW